MYICRDTAQPVSTRSLSPQCHPLPCCPSTQSSTVHSCCDTAQSLIGISLVARVWCVRVHRLLLQAARRRLHRQRPRRPSRRSNSTISTRTQTRQTPSAIAYILPAPGRCICFLVLLVCYLLMYKRHGEGKSHLPSEKDLMNGDEGGGQDTRP